MSSHAVLLVSSSEKFISSASAALCHKGFMQIRKAASGGEALRRAQQGYISLALIGTVPDKSPLELAQDISEAGVLVILFLPRENFELTQQVFENNEILVLPRPVSGKVFNNALLLMQGLLGAKRGEGDHPEDIAQRAKALLMQTFEMNEQKAYRFIQKNSMNLRLSLKDTAAVVLRALKEA